MQHNSEEELPVIPRPCIVKMCGEPSYIRGKCKKHSKESNLRHNNSHTAYQSPAYKKARERCLARCYYQCSHCGRNSKLHVHHISGNARDNNDLNLIVLCEHCHLTYERDIGSKHAAIQCTIDEYVAYWRAKQ